METPEDLTAEQFTKALDQSWASAPTGGTDLPQVSGRVERLGNGGLQMQLAMREYAAGTARLMPAGG